MNPSIPYSDSEILRIAKRQRVICWLIVVGIVGFISASAVADNNVLPQWLWLMMGLVYVGVAAICVNRLAEALQSRFAWLYSLLALIPYVGLLPLLVLSMKATSALKARGIQVDWLGARKDDLSRLSPDFEETSASEEEKSSRKKGVAKGCLALIVIGVGCIVLGVWKTGESWRCAERVQRAIHVGMSLDEVETLLKAEKENRPGVLSYGYEVKQDGEWKTLGADALDEVLAHKPTNSPDVRISLTFSAGPPTHVSFKIEFDGAGKVSKVTTPYAWD